MSNYWVEFNNESLSLDTQVIGGKGFGLFKLVRMGAKVPEFGVVTTDTHQYYLENSSFPEGFTQEVARSISSWPECEYYAVRSSAQLEDGHNDSFAGMLSSFLFVKKEDINKSILQCFKSIEKEELKAYKEVKSIEGELRVAVVIQRMIPSKVSGVAFSRSPVNNSAELLIEACLGQGEGLVSGQVEVDKYIVNRFGKLVEQNVSHKVTKLDYSEEHKSVEVMPVDEKRMDQSCLKDFQVQKLVEEVYKLEEASGSPIDIEWAFDCYKAEEPYILQIRPITKSFPAISFYVDTNLSESYPGLVSPFTGSVIPILYKNVFTSAAAYLGGSKGKIKQLVPHYSNLVKYIDGHLYYHLADYYAALSALSGGEKNIDNWHRMIGGKLDNISIKYENLEPSKFESIKSLGKLIKYVFFGGFTYNRFYKNAHQKRSEITYEIRRVNNLKDAIHLLGRIINDDFGFGLTVVNDYLVMTFLKLFEMRSKKAGISSNEIAKFLRTNEAIDSIKPLVALDKLVCTFENKEEFLSKYESLVEENNFISYKELYEKLSEFEVNIANMKEYLLKYGDRAFEELKFESLSFSDSPFEFFKFINWFSGSNQLHDLALKKGDDLPSLGLLDWWIWKKLHYFITQRENSRFIRGQFYSLIRKLFLKIIEFLREDEAFSQFERMDFYSLTLRDLLKFTRNENELMDLRDIIINNKNWPNGNKDFPEFLAWDNISEISLEADEYIPSEGDIIGEPANNINGKGKVLILKSPYDAFDINDLSDKILVTKTTDPAWVFIMSKCAGLISEKGSLLSHTAIIGRELSLPTVVGVKDATKVFQQGQEIEIDGRTGKIEIISS